MDHRARVWFAAHGITHIERIVTDNGACCRAEAFARALFGSRHQRITPYTPRHNGKVERYNRIISEEFVNLRLLGEQSRGRADRRGGRGAHRPADPLSSRERRSA